MKIFFLYFVVRRWREGRAQLECPVLSVESLLAELIEFDLAGEVTAHQILHNLADRRLEEVSIDPHEWIYLIVVNIGSSLEKSWYVVLQHCESRVHVLEDTHYCVVFFYRQFGSFQSTHGIKRSAFLAMPAKEERLPAMIADALMDLTFQISALPVALENARLEILLEPIGIG